MTDLEKLRNMLVYVHENTTDISILANNRTAAVGALLDVSVDHAKAVCTLFENFHFASAFALVRCLFETYVRAVWLLDCATSTELDRFLKADKIQLDNKKKTYFIDLVEAVETQRDWPATLSEVVRDSWNALNSYTHGGLFQVTRRYDGSTFEPHHTPEEVDGIIRFSALIAFLSFGEIIGLTANRELDSKTQTLFEKVSPWLFPKSQVRPAVDNLSI